jgi:hydrogenase expression/formation protein HypE
VTEPLGKIPPEVFERTIAPHLGAARPDVLLGPRAGTDAAVLRVGAGRVIAVTTDPLSIVPALGMADSARLACHLLASDLWTTGIPPAWASVCFNLPPHLPDADFEAYWQAMSAEWRALDVAVVAGHTGRYEGCDFSIVGAATLIGLGDEGRTLSPEFVKPGDRVVLTKGCAIEATAIAARMFPQRLLPRLEEDGVARAREMLGQVSTVADARAAVRIGVRDRGVTMLHDATEGGVLGGLVEVARATRHDLRVERARIPVSAEARAVCEEMGVDPYWTLSEGSLLVVVRPAMVIPVLGALADEGVAAAEIGEVVRGDGVLWLTEPDGVVSQVTRAEPDPWWPAYRRAVAEGWG